MGVKKRVFASESERTNFRKLARQWHGKYVIYHNLPFLNVFTRDRLIDFSDTDGLRLIELTDTEFNRLKKTSIDYTLCDLDDRPLVCVEFDGMSDGFNVGTKYHSDLPVSPWRKDFMELKLRVAYSSFFPFFVVGAQHFQDVSPELKLTIVDGIIGEALASRASRQKFNEGFVPEEMGWTKESFESLPSDTRHEIIQDWVIQVELTQEFEHSPIAKAVGKLQTLLGFPGWTTTYIASPDIEHLTDPRERARAIDEALLIGAICTVTSARLGEATARVYLPNFRSPFCGQFSLAENVAQLLALYKLKQNAINKVSEGGELS